ncbi:MAG: SixA phosphatase family protein [Solirubrobacteraceae bacterium]
MIWLLRHGDAADGAADAERPLTEKGVAQAMAAGRALAALGVRIDACLTSPRLRALDTARHACQALGVQPEVERALDGDPFDAAALAAGRGEVLLVGHNPSLPVALGDLTGARVRLRKGGLAAVANGELVLLVAPAQLRAIADGAGSGAR